MKQYQKYHSFYTSLNISWKGFVLRNGSHSTSKALFQVDLICILSWMGKTKPNTRFCSVLKRRKRGNDIYKITICIRGTPKKTLNREREYQMRERGRERAVKLTLPVGEAGEFDPLCKLHSRQRNTLKKKFLEISTGIVVQTKRNTEHS